MKSRSLTRRTIAVVLLAEFLCALAFSATALLHERRIRLKAFDMSLQGRSDSLLGAVQDAEDPEDNVTIDPAELRVSPDDVYAVYQRGGRLLGRSQDAPAALIQLAKEGYSDRSVGKNQYRVFERNAMRVIDRAENAGVGLERPITIIYAAPTNHIWHEIREAAGFYAMVSICLFVFTAGFMIVLLRRVLQPIDDLAVEASGVSMTSLQFNAPPSALELRELKPLAEALSAAIQGLREAFEKEHRFVSDAAHELKTAVAVVRSTIQVLMMKSRSQDEYAEGLERLLLDNNRVEALVSQMLMLARFEERTGPDAATADLAISVCTVVSSLKSFAEQRSVTLATEVTSNMPVHMSRERAEILVSNLVVNAVQHSPGGAVVEISLTRMEDTAVLRVRDEGSGISTEAVQHVFERFFREDASRSRDTGGAGLGLAICKSIVDSAGGSIAVESTKGIGTTATATFSVA